MIQEDYARGIEKIMNWQKRGSDPDYRFTLANERTFLAWIRTALAILAGSILLHQFADALQPRWVQFAASSGLAGLSAVLGGGAYLRWRANEIAMRLKKSLPRSLLIPTLSVATAILAAGTSAYLLWTRA